MSCKPPPGAFWRTPALVWLGHRALCKHAHLCDLAEIQGALAENVRQDRDAHVAHVDAELARRPQLRSQNGQVSGRLDRVKLRLKQRLQIRARATVKAATRTRLRNQPSVATNVAVRMSR